MLNPTRSVEDCVEQQRERGARLGAEIDLAAERHDIPLPAALCSFAASA